jgi:hypothetical protein
MHRKIDYYEIGNAPLPFVMQELSVKCKSQGVLINFEEASDPNRDKLLSYEFKDLLISDLVSKILNNHKCYTWASKNNIINIVPSNSNSDYILDQVIFKISIKNRTRDEIVQLVLTELDKINPGKYRTGIDKNIIAYQLVILNLPYKELGISPPILTKHSFEFKDITFRDILNEISKSENICWQVTLSDEGTRILVFMDPSTGTGLQNTK